MSTKFFEHKQTGKRYVVLSINEEKGVMRLKGSHAEFDEPLDYAHFEKMGYVLHNGDPAEARPLAPSGDLTPPPPPVAAPPPPPVAAPPPPVAAPPPPVAAPPPPPPVAAPPPPPVPGVPA